jgi:glycosyltransferase involved in cell wall biosynthesis
MRLRDDKTTDYRPLTTDYRPLLKTAVIFHRLGPYHFARLRAIGRLLPVTAIETSGRDGTYAWDLVAGSDGFERVTLFDRADAQTLPARTVASRMGSALDKIRPRVVVVPGWADPAALGALQWSVQNRVPAVIMSESTAWDAARGAWREAMKRRVVGLGSAALVGGRPHKEYMGKLGMPAERVFLGYDAVDGEYFASGAQRARSQAVAAPNSQLPAPSSPPSDLRSQVSDLMSPISAFQDVSVSAFQNAPYFLASARFVEKKNLTRLIEAYALYRKKSEVRSQKSDLRPLSSNLWSLVLLGDGPLKSDLCRLISDLGLQDSVLLPGFKQYPDLPMYYGLASAFIHVSTTEQWGLVVNEAMASGLPVLVSNRCGCAPDLVKDGVNGFTFDPYNIEEMANTMMQVWSMERRAAARGQMTDDGGRKTENENTSPRPSPRRGEGGLFQCSTLNAQPSTTLAEMGAASRAIISEWGPERFAAGLKAAVEKALEVGPKQAGVMDHLVLRALLAR